MIKVINGKRYDTEKADQVASWSNGYNYSDFHHCSETVYRTKKGNWFLHGDGNALSKYSRCCGNGQCGMEIIRALSEDEAFEWCVEHDAIGAIEKYFSERIEEA